MLELCYRKIFLMKDFSTSTKSQLTIKNRVSQMGMLAPFGGARKHSGGFKTAFTFLSCIKSAFFCGCSVLIFQRCYALVICNLQTSEWRKTLSIFVIGYNQALKTKCVRLSKRVVTGSTILYLALATLSKRLKTLKLIAPLEELTAFSQTRQLNTSCWVFDAKSLQENF